MNVKRSHYTGRDRWRVVDGPTKEVRPVSGRSWQRIVSVAKVEVRENELDCGHWERFDFGYKKKSTYCSECWRTANPEKAAQLDP
jgi:hypothetical protein